jgi:hypothetical protein
MKFALGDIVTVGGVKYSVVKLSPGGTPISLDPLEDGDEVLPELDSDGALADAHGGTILKAGSASGDAALLSAHCISAANITPDSWIEVEDGAPPLF